MKKRTGEPFMPAGDYGRSLQGFGVNLLVRDVARAVAFQTEVLGVELVHADADFAVLSHRGHQWMLHADHTYGEHPLLSLTGDGAIRGAGAELYQGLAAVVVGGLLVSTVFTLFVVPALISLVWDVAEGLGATPPGGFEEVEERASTRFETR